jgi:imidazolonepropionase-like amidohydrolase
MQQMTSSVLHNLTLIDGMGRPPVLDAALVLEGEHIQVVGPRDQLTLPTEGVEWQERKAAREQLKAGADLIKVMASGAVLTPGEKPGAPQYDVEEMRVAVEEAEKVGKSVAAHAHGAQAIHNAVRAGVWTIEHGTYLAQDPEIVDRMAEQEVLLIPTLKSLHDLLDHKADGVPRWAIEKGHRNRRSLVRSVRLAQERGVTIAMGTDAGTPYNYHGENALELVLMVEAGLSPMEAIVASTRNAAQALGQQEKLGTVEQGKLADLVVVRSNPLADVKTLTHKDNIETVFVGGQKVVCRS